MRKRLNSGGQRCWIDWKSIDPRLVAAPGDGTNWPVIRMSGNPRDAAPTRRRSALLVGPVLSTKAA